MKASFLSILLVTMCMFLQAKANCHFDGQDLTVGQHIVNCNRVTCHADGHLSAVGCGTFQCENQIGYQETDLSKPYPECCARPICA